MNNRKLLEKTIGYTFNDESFLKIAMTHCSAGQNNNERYEFLGDSLVNLIIAEALYKQFDSASEGQLTRLRAICVKGETLACIAQEFGLGEQLKLGAGELRSGGANRPSILADALEALIAAIYLDSDFATIKACVLSWNKKRLEDMTLEMTQKDPKTQLQECLQADHKPLPTYTVVGIEGESHEQMFKVDCTIADCEQTFQGEGSSRRRAEQNAAKLALEYLNNDTD